MIRTCSCCSAGKTSMIRSTVPGALCVCSVPRTRWPVSAAVSAVPIVSRSRISPTRITSGSWRSAARRASPKLIASTPISRWLTMQRLCRCTNSIGSSIVRMWSVPVAVDLVDHRRERRRLARPGRAGDEDEAARLHRQLGERARQVQLLERLELLGDDAERRSERLALEVDVDAEAGEAGDGVRGVDLPLDLELLLLLGREDAVEQLLRVLRRSAPARLRGARARRGCGSQEASPPTGGGRRRRARPSPRGGRRSIEPQRAQKA